MLRHTHSSLNVCGTYQVLILKDKMLHVHKNIIQRTQCTCVRGGGSGGNCPQILAKTEGNSGKSLGIFG